jgi:ubiquinone/menaquinone biosynthesis C-methylase UbiE
MRRARDPSPTTRRQHVRRVFDDRVQLEWKRYAGEPRRVLNRVLRERFLRLHLRGSRGNALELGPGPGRFSPILRSAIRGRVIAVDLSREMLRAARRRARGTSASRATHWVQGAGEHLPLSTRSIDVAVAFGNIVSFAADDGPVLLKELGRVVKPNGLLIADFASPAAATQEFFYVAAHRRLLPRILRRPHYFFIDRVLTTGFQPYDPDRFAQWAFRFYTVGEAKKAIVRAGFRLLDVMSVAPIAATHNRIAAIARREGRMWEALLRIEEQVGRRPGVLEAGEGFVVAAARR